MRARILNHMDWQSRHRSASAAARWGSAMKAKELIDGASYGSDALRAIRQAFDDGWTEIAGNFGDDPHDIERARLRLARAMLSVATDDSRDVEVLKRAALEQMALD